MQYSFFAKLSAEVIFTKEEFDFIFNACTHHYDATVRRSTLIGGFLFGLKNRFDFNNSEPTEIELSFRQIDELVKSLEMYNEQIALELTGKLTDILKQINSLTKTTTNFLNQKQQNHV